MATSPCPAVERILKSDGEPFDVCEITGRALGLNGYCAHHNPDKGEQMPTYRRCLHNLTWCPSCGDVPSPGYPRFTPAAEPVAEPVAGSEETMPMPSIDLHDPTDPIGRAAVELLNLIAERPDSEARRLLGELRATIDGYEDTVLDADPPDEAVTARQLGEAPDPFGTYRDDEGALRWWR